MVLNLQDELNKHRNFKTNSVNFSVNEKELEILKEKIDNIERDSNFLISINNEELKNYKENFNSFLASSQTFLLNLKNLFIALKKNLPLQEYSINNNINNNKNNASISLNTDLFLKDKILEKIENEFSKFDYLISQNISNNFNNNNNNNEYHINQLNHNTNFTNNHEINNYNANHNLKTDNINYTNNDLLDNRNKTNLLSASKQKNKELTEMLNKLELKNKLLEEQLVILKYNYNSELKQKFAAEENPICLSTSLHAKTQILNPDIASSNFEFAEKKLKSEFENLKEKNEETEATLDYIRKLNKDLETKNYLLEEELIKARKNVKAANERLIGYESLKQKNDDLEKEVKYKKSIIAYLENVLKINKSKIKKLKAFNLIIKLIFIMQTKFLFIYFFVEKFV